MIISLGIDIVEVERMATAFSRFGDRLPQRILTADELLRLDQNPKPAHFLARRFAVKEAAAKALGTGFKGGVRPRDICSLNLPSGAPYLKLTGAARHRFEALGAKRALVSVSDEAHLALAQVILLDR